MERINFHTIFRLNDDGSIEPLRIVRIGGVQMGPGVKFGRGVIFGGVNLYNFIGKDFQTTTDENGTLVINGIYGQ